MQRNDENFPSSRELETLSLVVYHRDTDFVEGCRDAAILAVLAQFRSRLAPLDAAIRLLLDLQCSDFHSGDGRLTTGETEFRLKRSWLAAATGWLIVRGLRPGPLFCSVKDDRATFEPLTSDEVHQIVHRRREEGEQPT